MEKIKLLFTTKADPVVAQPLINHLETLPIDLEVMKPLNGQGDFDVLHQVSKKWENDSRLIVVDDYGTLPFLIFGKNPRCVVAQISDEHSAHMTSEHNGANVICLGTALNGVVTLKNIMTKFINQPFAAGRHLVRTDMLKTLLAAEGEQ